MNYFAGVAELANLAMQQKNNYDMIDNQNRLLKEQQRFQVEQNDRLYSTYRDSLEKAGLNLNAMYGGYPNTSSSVPQSAQLTAPKFDASTFTAMSQQQQNQPLIDAQVAKTEAETREIEERIANLREDTTGKQLANVKSRFDNEHLNENWDLALREGLSRIGVNTSSQDVNFATAYGRGIENRFQEETFEDRKRELSETIAWIVSRKDLTDQQKTTEIAKAQEAYASALEKRASAREHDAKTRETIELLDPKKNKLINDSGLSEANQLLVLYKASIAESDADWRDIENFLKGTGLGVKSVSAIVSGLRKAHSALKD